MKPTPPKSGLKDWVWWLLRRRYLIEVINRSMLPHLQPGDRFFVDPNAYRQARPQEGDLVVAIDPRQTDVKIIKRIGAVLRNERYFLSSDNPTEGTDSRTFGVVPLTHIVGKVTSRAAQGYHRHNCSEN